MEILPAHSGSYLVCYYNNLRNSKSFKEIIKSRKFEIGISQENTFISKDFSKIFGELTNNFSDSSYTYEIKGRIEELKTMYEFADVDSIIMFLINNNEFIEILDKIHENLLKYFFKDDVLLIETFHDPEEPEAEYLLLKIITKSSVNDAFDRLANFEKEWYHNNVDFVHTNLIFDVGYR